MNTEPVPTTRPVRPTRSEVSLALLRARARVSELCLEPWVDYGELAAQAEELSILARQFRDSAS